MKDHLVVSRLVVNFKLDIQSCKTTKLSLVFHENYSTMIFKYRTKVDKGIWVTSNYSPVKQQKTI